MELSNPSANPPLPESIQADASLDDLRAIGGKADLIAGRIVHRPPTGYRPGIVVGRIFRSLDERARRTGLGVALPDNVGFVVPELASGRRSFSPDAAYFLGDLPADEMDFIAGPPTLAVEIRGKRDHGPAAESEMAAKRANYFEAGTRVVRDVDPRAGWIRSYSRIAPTTAREFGPGDLADAEPAVPGWRLSIDEALA